MFRCARDPLKSLSTDTPRGVFLTATSLTLLKPIFKRALRPVASRLAQAGVTANQVTLASLAGSIAVGMSLCAASQLTPIFAMLPIWLLVRMACATIDGTLAIEFGQKSRLGGILNEAGDILSDAALFLPLAFVAPLSLAPILVVIALATVAELVGILGATLGQERRLEGPLGKADRSIVLAVIGATIAILGELPGGALVVVPALALCLLMTIWNRLRFIIADRAESAT